MKSAPLIPAISKQNFRHAKVLVVENDPQGLTLICRHMSDHLPEVDVVCTTSHEQAISYLTDHRLDEWKLPKMILLAASASTSAERRTMLNAIKKMGLLVSQIPVVILSQSDDEYDVGEAYESGVASYLVKPKDEVDWPAYFQRMRVYWWEVVSLPTSDYRY